jgi:hypothetical protein
MITTTIETIDAETAKHYLRMMNDNNRNLDDGYVGELMAIQKQGKWKVNGDSIRFDTNNELRDGQHRLRMVERTGNPIQVVVVRGIEPDAFMTMDCGKRRTFADTLEIHRWKYARQLAATTNWVWKYLTINLIKGDPGCFVWIRSCNSTTTGN